MLTPASVVYIDPFVEQKLTFDGKDFGVLRDENFATASRVSYSDIVIHSFKANTNIGEDELRTMVEIKMYEEAGLDLQKRYKIIYIKKDLDFADTTLVEVFAIEEDKARITLANVLSQNKYIDFLAIPFLTFSTLYHNKILAPQNDLFVYIAESEAFLAIYKNGHYISTKSIMNLQDIAKKLKFEDIEISSEDLQTILVEKGLDGSKYTQEEISLSVSIQTIFLEIFTKINDILLHNRNVFGFDQVDRIFMSTANGRIRGLRDFLLSFGYTDTTLHDFNLFKNCQSDNTFSCIVTSYVHDKYTQKDMAENCTIFVRPPSFLKTELGKFSVVALSACAIFMLYPLYLFVSIHFLQEELNTLTAQSEEIKKNAVSFNAQLTRAKDELKNAKEVKSDQTKSLENVTQSIDELYEMKMSSKNYTGFITQVNMLLKKHSLMVKSMEQKGANKMSIEVVAKQSERENIAKFMEDLIRDGFFGVTTDEIKSDTQLYVSKIEIER